VQLLLCAVAGRDQAFPGALLNVVSEYAGMGGTRVKISICGGRLLRHFLYRVIGSHYAHKSRFKAEVKRDEFG
jgi:hypothetical protein